MLVSHFFSHYYVPLRLIGSSPGTVEQYRIAIRAFDRHLGRKSRLSDLTDQQVAAALLWQLEIGNSPSSANRLRRHLLSLWRFARDQKRLRTIPEIRKIRESKRIPQAWSISEIGRLLQACQRVQGLVGDVPASAFWQALVLVIYDTGLRKGAALRLRPSYYDAERRLLRVPGSIQKQRCAQDFRLSAQTVDALSACHSPTSRWLLPWPHDRYRGASWHCLMKHFRRIVAAAGLSSGGRPFHKIRRTRATVGEALRPGSATKDLGHSSPDVTRESYIDPVLLDELVGTESIVDQLPRPI